MSGSIQSPSRAGPEIPAQHPVKASASQAAADARQQLAQAQARVDADRRAHSPSCVAVDQKAVDQANQLLAAANAAHTTDGSISIVA